MYLRHMTFSSPSSFPSKLVSSIELPFGNKIHSDAENSEGNILKYIVPFHKI